MNPVQKFMTETYPRIWWQAWNQGKEAQEKGLPRKCNLQGEPFCYGTTILKVYKSAWEQGWDRHTIPAIFGQMERALQDLPLRPVRDEDLI